MVRDGHSIFGSSAPLRRTRVSSEVVRISHGGTSIAQFDLLPFHLQL